MSVREESVKRECERSHSVRKESVREERRGKRERSASVRRQSARERETVCEEMRGERICEFQCNNILYLHKHKIV